MPGLLYLTTSSASRLSARDGSGSNGRLARRILLIACALAMVSAGLSALGQPADSDDAGRRQFRIRIATLPDADVFVDGRNLPGLTNAAGVAVASVARPGSYEIRVEKEGYVPATEIVEVDRSAELVRVDISLVPEGGVVSRGDSGFDWTLILFVVLGIGAAAGLVAVGYLATQRFVRHRKNKPRGRPHLDEFDRYIIEGELGRGGMATVYLARDRETNERAALKLMHPDLMNDSLLVRKFLNEGEALYSIAQTDPGAPVVRPLYYGRENNRAGGRPFVALEFLDGESLLSYLRIHGPLPAEQAIDVIEQICYGLRAAHTNGIWHRDVTPDNVIVIASGPRISVRLIDFGVAKHEFTSHRTMDGTIVGKPPYMSPEQCRGEPIDGRSDIYSLGAVFYTLIAGNPPFVDPNPLIVMKMHETEPVPPLPLGTPGEVEDLIGWMLDKDVNRRPESIDDVIRAIRDLDPDLTMTYRSDGDH